MFFRVDYFCLTMALMAAGSYRRHCTSAPGPSAETSSLEVRGKVAYAGLSVDSSRGAKHIVFLSQVGIFLLISCRAVVVSFLLPFRLPFTLFSLGHHTHLVVAIVLSSFVLFRDAMTLVGIPRRRHRHRRPIDRDVVRRLRRSSFDCCVLVFFFKNAGGS